MKIWPSNSRYIFFLEFKISFSSQTNNLTLINHQLMCQSGKWLLCPHQVSRFDTPYLHCVDYTISMCGLKTNWACVGLGSLSSTFELVILLGLPICILGHEKMTAYVSSPLFFLKKKKKLKIDPHT